MKSSCKAAVCIRIGSRVESTIKEKSVAVPHVLKFSKILGLLIVSNNVRNMMTRNEHAS